MQTIAGDNSDRDAPRQLIEPAQSAKAEPTSPSPHTTAYKLARRLGAQALRMTLFLQSLRMVCRLGFAAALAVFAGEMIESGVFSWPAFAGALAGLILSSGTGYYADTQTARAEATLIGALRQRLETSLAAMPAARLATRPAGALIAGLQRHPPALAGLTISHAATQIMLALAPLAAAAAIAVVSWQAAITLLLAIPVMIGFFILLGSVVRDRARAQEVAFGRLAAQFADRIRALPTILANHALTHEHDKIERRMADYANSTMGVLKPAFLNAGIIDFFAALSIAVLAVFLGLGHLGLVHIPGFTGLMLWQSLFILIIAADFFTPFRRYAEQYHLKAEGEAAAKELDWYFAAADTANGPARFVPAGLDNFDPASLPRNGLIAISGPSGAGKSTMLRILGGIDAPLPTLPALTQIRHPIVRTGYDWISTGIYVPAGTLADAIGWRLGNPSPVAICAVAERVGLLNDNLLPGGLAARISDGGDNLSGGQRMRIGIARMLLSDRVVLADEPTAKLDPATARLVRDALEEAAKQRLVIVATHDDALIKAADRNVILRLATQDRAAA
ncbi:MAG: ATP-binding cassette domain-containing protein [Rhodopseudomonas sp.]|nr:ATP-binding cassette domain-containing protein [Rhodopseudomonas sp.]